jgi:Fe-S-cluster containining protein
MKKSNYEILNDYLLELQKVDSLEKMDAFVSEVTGAVGDVYPCISCKTGCYTCCTGPSMPTVYAKEWQRIREYIKTLPEDTQKAIKEKSENIISNHEEIINFIHEVIQKSATMDDLKKYLKRMMAELKDESCPMHINGKCSVYEVRPTKCRIFGYFSMAFDNQVHMLSCISDINKMQDYLVQQKTKQSTLPFWGYLENKLIKFVLDDSEKYNMTIIPLWMKDDFETGKLDLK